MFSCEFCQISKKTFFAKHLWATTSILLEGRRLKQIEISIISKITKKIIKNEKFLRLLFFTCCARPFSFRASLFTKRPYVSLYSYFHSVQTCWISVQIILGWNVYTSIFLFFIPGWNFISVKTCQDDFILGWNFRCKHANLKYNIVLYNI